MSRMASDLLQLDVSRWCPGARYALISGAAGAGVIQRVTDQTTLLVGVLLRAGAATATLKLFNEKAQNQGAGYTGDASKELPGAKAATFDGWVNFPVFVSEGIIATLDQTDAIGWVFFIPLPSSIVGQA